MVVSKIIHGVEGKKLSSSWSLSAYRLFRNTHIEAFIKVIKIDMNSYETSTHTHDVVFEGTSTSHDTVGGKNPGGTTWDGAKKTL